MNIDGSSLCSTVARFPIERLRAEPANDPSLLRIAIETQSDPGHRSRIEANLFKIVDVLSVHVQVI